MIDFGGAVPAVHVMDALRAMLVAVVWISLASLMREPARRKTQAVIVALAAGVYLDGGFGAWELAFAVLVAFCALRGLESYRWIGVGWLAHTFWDIAHHASGMPMISWLPTSAFDCAVTDTLLVLWLFAGAPDVFAALRRKRPTSRERPTS